MKNPAAIAITGASSGLGAALALHYAANGVTLYLQGRDAERLASVAQNCAAKGGAVFFQLFDVTNRTAMQNWLTDIDQQTPIDLIIANAGISAGSGTSGEPAWQADAIMATNVEGVLNTIQPLIPAMVSRGRGQLAIISSLAGIRALPSSPAYSASKACVASWGDALRGWLAKSGVKVSVVFPGYIKTPMTDVNDFPMPFLMHPEKAAAIIAAGLAKGKGRIGFPRALYLPLRWLAALPAFLTDPFFSRLPSKPAWPEK